MGPMAAVLPGGRLHLQHGPIDLVIGVDPPEERLAAFRAAETCFATVLMDLVSELRLLRRPLGAERLQGMVARRMGRAVEPYPGFFVTPMAAVAGAVADCVLQTICLAAPVRRAYVNNGGDIAIHLTAGCVFQTAMQDNNGRDLGHIALTHCKRVGGIATSGRHGRSLSLGIADSVTVLARSAAEADVAATLIANAVDLPDHGAIRRRPAELLDPDSDLGGRLAVMGLGPLTRGETAQALQAGWRIAQDIRSKGLIHSAALFLNGQAYVAGDGFAGTVASSESALV